MRPSPTHTALLIGLLSATLAWAEVENGKELHEESCVECHMMSDHTALYTRRDRKVNSLHRLGGQVSACTQTLDIGWFPDEERDVVEYLNSRYYRFSE
jgi:hypothetical protein